MSSTRNVVRMLQQSTKVLSRARLNLNAPGYQVRSFGSTFIAQKTITETVTDSIKEGAKKVDEVIIMMVSFSHTNGIRSSQKSNINLTKKKKH